MNIFVLDQDIGNCARYHNDKHTVKMILEYAQLLSGAHHYAESPQIDRVYKATHMNHPCAIWTRESQKNYIWLYRLFISLCGEYMVRYHRIHKTLIKLGEVLENVPKLPNTPMTPFAQAMDDKYKHSDPVIAYRNYYMGAKRDIAQWKTVVPEWWV